MAFSTLGSWALLVWEELIARGADAQAVFAESGLDVAKLKLSGARYPVQAMRVLWEKASKTAPGDDFGVSVGKRWRPTTFHALGFAWLASDTLGDAFARLVRYGALVNDRVDYSLRSDGATFTFIIGAPSDVEATSLDAAVVSVVVMCRMLRSESFSPKRVIFPRAPNGSAISLDVFLRCPIEYTIGKTTDVVVEIDRAEMDAPLNTANAELLQANERIILDHLSRLEHGRMANKVRQFLVAKLPARGVTEAQAAAALAVSMRTLQRKLLEEGESFSKLLEDTRRELADRYVRDHALSFSDVTYLLGFSDQANFSRAFRRWYNCSPSQYRKGSAA